MKEKEIQKKFEELEKKIEILEKVLLEKERDILASISSLEQLHSEDYW